MALEFANITFDLSDQLGVDFDPRRTKVWITTNVPNDTVIDQTGNKIRLGSGNVTVNPDGTGQIDVWKVGQTGLNPLSWQTTVHVDYPDRNERGGRGRRDFGPFTIASSGDLAVLVAEQEVPPTYVSQVTAQLDAKVTEASGYADAAAASAAQAKSVAEIDTSDALVTNLFTTPGTDLNTAATATYATHTALPSSVVKGARRANTLVLLGDSITAANFAVASPVYNYNGGRGFWTWANIGLRRRLHVLKVAGVVGETTAQILARVDADVIANDPAYCFVVGGTNDINGSVSTATITANLAAIYDKLDAAGIAVIAGTVIPYTAAKAGAVASVNQWLREQARLRKNFLLVDWTPQLSDASTGAFTAALTYDGMHPNTRGAQVMGKEAARVLAAAIKPAPDPLPATNADTTNKFTNGCLVGATLQGNTVSPGLSVSLDGSTPSGVFTTGKVARTDGMPGEWQQVKITTAGWVKTTAFDITTSLTAGDKYQLAVEYERDNDWSGIVYAQIRLWTLGSTVTVYDAQSSSGDTYSPTDTPTSGIFQTPALTVPAGATGLKFALDFNGLGTIRWGRMYLRKVT